MKRALAGLIILAACQEPADKPPLMWTGSILADSLGGCYSLELKDISGFELPKQLVIMKQDLRASFDSGGRDLRVSNIPYSIDWKLNEGQDTVQIRFSRPTHFINFQVVAWAEGFQGIASESWDNGPATDYGTVRAVRISCDSLQTAGAAT